MAFLRTLFWILLTIVLVVFTLHNWQAVTIDLFAGLQADVKLPVLLLIAFLIGFVPLYVYHRIRMWQQRRRPGHDMASPIASPTAAVFEPAAPPATPINAAIPPPADTV